jgi:heme a synthase
MHVESSRLARVRSLEMTPTRFAWIALAAALALYAIVVSGAVVRLTASGLGCESWPGCEAGSFFPESDAHAFVEFGNRLVGGVTIALTLLGWLAARRTPNLPTHVTRIALAIFLGTLAQAPIGLLAVATDLRWPVVAAHLLLSMLLIAGAVALVIEAVRRLRARRRRA